MGLCGCGYGPEAIFKKLEPVFYGQLQSTSQTASVFQLFAHTHSSGCHRLNQVHICQCCMYIVHAC